MVTEEGVAALAGRVADMAIERRQPVSKVIDPKMLKAVNGKVGEELKRSGLIYLGNNELHRRQSANGRGADSQVEIEGPDGAPSVRQSGHPHPRDEADVLMRVRLATSDDSQLLPVLEMPIADLRAAVAACRGLATGWTTKATALEFAAESCEKAGVDKLRDLTPKKLAVVREQFEKIWGAG
jgi:hypothetical protein